MKYSVVVNDKRLSVEAVGESIAMDGRQLNATLQRLTSEHAAVLRIGDRVYRVAFERKQIQDGSSQPRRGHYTIWIDGERFEVDALDERRRAIEEATASKTSRRVADLKAPMPGLIVNVRVAEGDTVQAGQGLIVMEAMKMENELRATSAGIIKRIHVVAGRAVEKGSLLIEIGE